jgi:hypothetical protein
LTQVLLALFGFYCLILDVVFFKNIGAFCRRMMNATGWFHKPPPPKPRAAPDSFRPHSHAKQVHVSVDDSTLIALVIFLLIVMLLAGVAKEYIARYTPNNHRKQNY